MTDDLSRLEPEQLDELISAGLDGELDAAARDLGLDPAEVPALLRATPGVDERREAIAAARGLLVQTPEIDELLAARLRAKAVRAHGDQVAVRLADRRRRRNRVLLGAGGVAAAMLGVLAVAAGLRANTSSSKASRAARPDNAAMSPEKAAAPNPTASLATPSLGEFTDAHALALVAVDRGTNVALGQTRDSSARSATKGLASSSTTAAPAAGTPTALGNHGQFDAGASMSGGESCAPSPPPAAGDSLVLRATATLAGKPVIVLVFAGNGEHIVVIRDTNCTLVNLQILP